MNYIVSQWGKGVSVGLAGTPEEVRVDATLAHNLFKINFFDDLFNGRLNFPSVCKFYRFLIYKHALPTMSRRNRSLAEAIKINKKQVRSHFILFKNFMNELDKTPYSYKMGVHNDGDFGYYYED